MADVGIVHPGPPGIESSTIRKVKWRLLPFLGCLYFIAMIDRFNVGFAALELKSDMEFDPEVIGFGSGVFFLGYFLLEIPGTILVEMWSARKWIARIMISWGIIAALMGFIQNSTQFYISRFLLGLGEAGFFPGVIVYLTHWFLDRDRVKAVSTFFIGNLAANILGAPFAGLILGVNWLGLAGWRWLFILEGIPAVVFGIATIFYLTDRPSEADWLTSDERQWLSTELQGEREAKKAIRHFSIFEAFKNRNVVLLTIAYFLGLSSAYGINYWLPTMLKELSGQTNLGVSLLAMVPYCAGLTTMIFLGRLSDKSRHKRWYAIISLLVMSCGLYLAATAGGNLLLALTMVCVALAAWYCFLPTFWSLPVMFLTESAAAASIGLINSLGNLGGFVGPYAVGYLIKANNSFYGGIIYLSISAVVGAVAILMIQKKVLNSRVGS